MCQLLAEEDYLFGIREAAAGASTSLLPLCMIANSNTFILGEWSSNCSHTAMTPAEIDAADSSMSSSCSARDSQLIPQSFMHDKYFFKPTKSLTAILGVCKLATVLHVYVQTL